MFQFLTPFAFVLALGLLLFLILFQLYSFRPSRLCGRSAHEVYAQNLLPDNGFAPWFPGPVNIAEVGYVFFGQWIPFFDTSKEWQEDENKGRSKPEGYYPLVIGEISDKMYSGVPIMKERGSSLAIGTNPPTPSMGAGAPWNFTSSKQEGAILVAGDVIEIRDATETSKFIRYMQEHCVSWVKFIGRPEIRLFDLVLVSGWHKTSSWACATFSDCSSAVHIELAHARGKWSIVTSSGIIAHAGPVQLRTHEQAGESHMPQSEENVNTVDHSSSDHSRKGNLTVPKGLETELNITSGSDKMVRLSQAARRTHQETVDGINTGTINQKGPRDQGIFIRGYRICDRHTGLALLYHWQCSDRESRDKYGFNLIEPRSHKGGDNHAPGGTNPGPGGNSPGPGGGSPGPGGGSPGPGGGSPGPGGSNPGPGGGSPGRGGGRPGPGGGRSGRGGGRPGPGSNKGKNREAGPSRSRQDLPSGNSSLSSSEGEDVARFGTGGISDRNTSPSHLSMRDSKVGIDVDEDLALYLQLKQSQTPTALDITLLYILENSDAEFALVHDDDVMVWLKDGPIPGNLTLEIQNIRPQIFVVNQIGMLETTYLASLKNQAGTEQVVMDRSSDLPLQVRMSDNHSRLLRPLEVATHADDERDRMDCSAVVPNPPGHSVAKRREIYNWLSAPDYQLKHRNSYKEREELSGLWFLHGDRFQEWKRKPGSCLWLQGKSGAGKTILCSAIIEDISRYCKPSPSLAISYFYFDFNSKDIRTHSVLRALIKQLSLQCASTPDTLAKLFSDNKDGERSPSPEELKSTVKSIIGSFDGVYIIFDALDECPDRHDFLELLEEFHGWDSDKIHLLATSRSELDILKTMDRLGSYDVPMDENLVADDICVYVSKRIDRDSRFKIYSTHEKNMIETALINGAHGMFRWVTCQLDALRKCRPPAALEKALGSLPKTLYQTYDRVLMTINEEDRQSASKILQWLAFSAGTISLKQAVEVLATDSDAEDEPLFDTRRRLLFPRDILTICSSLVTISVAGSESPDSDYSKDQDIAQSVGTAELRLAHFSVREYLVSEYLHKNDKRLSFYHFNEGIANTFIAKTCVAYLLQFDRHGCIDESTPISYPLSLYAARYWIHHAQPDNDGDPILQRLIMELLQPEDAVYSNWLELHNPDQNMDTAIMCAPIYYMSMAGLARVSRRLLENGADVNEQGGFFCNALQVASSNGDDGMVRMLLENGADVNTRGGYYGTALQAASYCGTIDIVRLLVESGADINARGGSYNSALQAASCGGNLDIIRFLLEMGAHANVQGEKGNVLQEASEAGNDVIVRILLEKGANVNAKGGYHGNALQVASSHGHDAIVRLLVDRGADVNAKGGEHGSALNAASSNGHHRVVRLLLEEGADINPSGVEYGSALQAASQRGHTDVIRLLVENGADVNVQGGLWGPALQAASLQSHESIVQLLLEKGANINARGGQFDNALQAAAYGGNEATVHLLLERGADIDAHGGTYGNALQAASLRGYSAVVRLLLNHGADVNAQGGQYGHALQAASYGGNQTTVLLLLDHGADVNVQGEAYGSALQVASLHGYNAIVQLLLEKGADINAQGGQYGNALQAAAYGDNKATVRLLLECGADINAQGGTYGNALQAASLHGYNAIVQLLLEKGADINAQGGQYGNALQAAAYGDNKATVQLLLEHGADVNAQGGTYGNALQAASLHGYNAIVQLLLDKGVDINAQGGQYGNALQAAAYGDNKETVQFLLGHRADINAQGGTYGNALQAASLHGYNAVVQLLLDHGVDINAPGGQYGHVLQAASDGGNQTTVWLLLEHGADVNAQGGTYGNALQAASLHGYNEIVQLLLEKGADINAQGGQYGNALQAAAYGDNKATVWLLLGRGADINAQGGTYGNALQAASLHGYNAIVQLLLEKGADINAQGGQYGNALQAAAYGGDQTIVRLLLDHGADVNAQGGTYGNALQAASLRGYNAVVRLLLDHGADINAQGGLYGNAFLAASYARNEATVRLLVEYGADVQAASSKRQYTVGEGGGADAMKSS